MSGIIFGGTVTPSRLSPNLFKNPNFAVIQGTASGTLANSTALPTASLGYLGEAEWFQCAAGGTPAYAFSSANESITFTGAAGTTGIVFGQRIESRDMVSLANRLATMTLSVEMSNTLITSIIWEVFRPTTTDNTHGTVGTPTQTLIASGTFTVTSTLTRYSATFTLPALASRGLDVRFRALNQTSGTWVIARPQLEEGSVATTFNSDSYSQELAKCQRYFETSYPSGVSFGSVSAVSGAGGISLTVSDLYNSFSPTPFVVKKRATPVMVGYSILGTIGVLYNLSLARNEGNIGFRLVSDSSFCVFCANSAMTPGNAFGVHFTASAHIP
jgi:hypothetical protein